MTGWFWTAEVNIALWLYHLMLPAERREGNGGKKVDVCGLIGPSKMSVFTTARLCLLLRATRQPGVLWLMPLLLRAWGGESRLGLSKTRKPTVKWGGLSQANAQTHSLVLFYVTA